jgi:hypothetical protein
MSEKYEECCLMNDVKPIDVFIVGAQKAGTSVLGSYLSKHLQISSHSRLEYDYFIDEAEYKKGYKQSFKRHFSDAKKDSLILAKSVSMVLDVKYLERLKELNPSVKIIYIVRNPVRRAISAYWYAVRNGWEDRGVEDALIHDSKDKKKLTRVEENNRSYLKHGRYMSNYNLLKLYFPSHNIQLLFLDDLKCPGPELNRIANWLGINEFDSTESERVNESSMFRFKWIMNLINSEYKLKKTIVGFFPRFISDVIKAKLSAMNEKPFQSPEASESTMRFLANEYKSDIKELEGETGRDLSGWL